jgi:CheY-like chemotaxis protein
MKRKLNCVLLIDDDEPTNFLNEMLIETANCTEHLQIAQSGKAALTYLAATGIEMHKSNNSPRPDLIFLDINMPAMNGWEFLQKYYELKKDNENKIITIMLTTSLNPDDKMKAIEMPYVSGYESKPLTPEKLYRILRKYFPHNF